MKTIYIHHLAGYVRAFVEIRPGILWESLYGNNPRSSIGGTQ